MICLAVNVERVFRVILMQKEIQLKNVSKELKNLKNKGYRYIRAQLGGYGGRENGFVPPKNAPDGCYYDPKVYMDKTIELFERLREKFGWDLGLCHDVHERLRPIEAVAFSKEMEKYKLLFLEDCLSPEQIGWFKQIRNHCVTPLAMGELFNNPNEWVSLITEREIDYIRIHLSQIWRNHAGKKGDRIV